MKLNIKRKTNKLSKRTGNNSVSLNLNEIYSSSPQLKHRKTSIPKDFSSNPYLINIKQQKENATQFHSKRNSSLFEPGPPSFKTQGNFGDINFKQFKSYRSHAKLPGISMVK